MRDPRRPRHQPYIFGPMALLRRVARWHTSAPLWQVLLLTAVLLGLIALTVASQLGLLPHP